MTARSLGGRAAVILGAVVAVAMLAVTWFLFVGPARSDAAGLRTSATGVETQNTVLSGQVAALRQQAAHRDKLAEQLRATLGGLPPGTNLPVFSRQLSAQAAARGVTLTGFSVGTPTVPATDGQAAPTGETTTAASTLAIPVTIQSSGPALSQLFFLRDIEEQGPRLALITTTSLGPGLTGGDGLSITDSSTMTVQLTVFTARLPKAQRTQLAGLLNDAPKS